MRLPERTTLSNSHISFTLNARGSIIIIDSYFIPFHTIVQCFDYEPNTFSIKWSFYRSIFKSLTEDFAQHNEWMQTEAVITGPNLEFHTNEYSSTKCHDPWFIINCYEWVKVFSKYSKNTCPHNAHTHTHIEPKMTIYL